FSKRRRLVLPVYRPETGPGLEACPGKWRARPDFAVAWRFSPVGEMGQIVCYFVRGGTNTCAGRTTMCGVKGRRRGALPAPRRNRAACTATPAWAGCAARA